MVIQRGTSTPDRQREKVKFRVESDLTLSTARMQKTRGLYCSLKASMQCTTPDCIPGTGFLTWLPEGSSMKCPGGICLIDHSPMPGERTVGYAIFKPGRIEEIKFVSTVSSSLDTVTTGFTVKNLPINELRSSTEDGDWESARFRVRGVDVGKYVSGVHYRSVDRNGNASSVKFVNFTADSELVCGMDPIPMRVD
jgi:hypothetical protein